MIRERIAYAALLAFPPDVRAARGAEMVSTLLDVSSASRVRFVGEIVNLVGSGARARGAEMKRAGAARVVGDGFCVAGVWLMVLLLTSDLGDRIHGPIPDYPRYLYGPWTLMLLGAALVLALIGYDRFAGAAAFLFTASVLLDPSRYELTAERVRLIVPATCFAVLLTYPRQRMVNLRRLVWLAPIAVLTVAAGTSDDAMAFVAVVALIVLVPTALALVRSNPRPMIACAVVAAYFGTHMAQDGGGPGPVGLLFLAATPLVVACVVAANRRSPTSSPV